jgi:1-acyl-sn-glycerol-3-phosphate acyltransferase
MWAVILVGLALGVLLVKWRQSGQRLRPFLAMGLVRLYGRLWHGCRSNGWLPLPVKGAAILYSNHTCSADGAFLQTWSRRGLHFLMAREYYDGLPLVRGIFDAMGCVLVRREGCDPTSVRTALRRLHAGGVVCIFPEGGLSAAGRRRFRRAKCGVALLALRSGAPVYPVLITGGPQHNNVPRAWLRPSRVRLTSGPAVDLSAYLDRPIARPLLEEVAAYLMKQVAALGTNRSKNHASR